MILLQILLATQLSFGHDHVTPVQAEIDRAFALILKTQTGRAICRDILGSDARAISLHLGVSVERSGDLARDCGNAQASEWVAPTAPADIRKLITGTARPRRYVFLNSEREFPIESWTDPLSNSTTILISGERIEFNRLVQILAHETAVYFDSKTNPSHPGAANIPHLKSLSLKSPNGMNPLIAVSDPLVAHTLTYLRALQVEYKIMRELEQTEGLAVPEDLLRSDIQYLVNSCAHACIEKLILEMRKEFLPIALPLLTFASHYRAVVLKEIARIVPAEELQSTRWQNAQSTLDSDPVQYWRTQFTGDVVKDLSHVFEAEDSQDAKFRAATEFADSALWALEWPAISQSRFAASGQSFLEFMKRPLLSGYNISISSGPRLFIRTGLIE